MSIPRWWLRTGLLIFGIWAVLGLVGLVQSFLIGRYASNNPRPLGVLLRTWLAVTCIGSALTPPIAWLSHRFRIAKETWLRNLPLHAAFCLIFTTIDAWLIMVLAPFVGFPPVGRPLHQTWVLNFNNMMSVYLIIAAVTHAVDYRRRFRERERLAAQLEIRSAQLEYQLGRSRLEALKAQLQPHFLFNTLHTVSELVHEDPAAADRMVTGLGDLLRMALDDADRQEVPLLQEMAFVSAYLEIERCRYADRLTVVTAIDPGTFDARIPHLILQPLVENAVRHGAGHADGECCIRIASKRRNGVLDITIENNGPGLTVPPSALREGVGLRNTRERLRVLYGEAQELRISNRDGGGVAVRLTMPYHV